MGLLTLGLSLGTLLVLKPMSLRPFGWLGQVRFLCLTSAGMCLVLTFCGRLGQPQGVVAVQLLKPCLLASPWIAACQASRSSTISWSLLKFMSIEWMMLYNHLILYHPLPRGSGKVSLSSLNMSFVFLMILSKIFPKVFPRDPESRCVIIPVSAYTTASFPQSG